MTDEDIRNVARVALRARHPENNEEVFDLAVVSQDPTPIVVEHDTASGYHDTFDEDGQAVFYGVLLNQSANSVEQAWHYLPMVFTHELVEACSDPTSSQDSKWIPLGNFVTWTMNAPSNCPVLNTM